MEAAVARLLRKNKYGARKEWLAAGKGAGL